MIYWQEGMHPTKNTMTTQTKDCIHMNAPTVWEEQDTAATDSIKTKNEEADNATE